MELHIQRTSWNTEYIKYRAPCTLWSTKKMNMVHVPFKRKEDIIFSELILTEIGPKLDQTQKVNQVEN